MPGVNHGGPHSLRQCATPACRRRCQFCVMGVLLPASLRRLDIRNEGYVSLAPLSRLTGLKELYMPEVRLDGPLPHLPALRTFSGHNLVLLQVSPVAATLENLNLTGNWTVDWTELAKFTCLCKLWYLADWSLTLFPTCQGLPPTLRTVTLAYSEPYPNHDQFEAFVDAGGEVVTSRTDGVVSLTWNRPAAL